MYINKAADRKFVFRIPRISLFILEIVCPPLNSYLHLARIQSYHTLSMDDFLKSTN